ncbi:MAG TPA: methyltransferase domain-containing protein [Christensenellaceae bacterium]|jgi:SAM-dependent methyltransferase|nr:methyltransferase domain-containing protein [Christensenellaceae bacterium]
MIKKTSIYEQLTTLPYLSAYQQLIQGAIELEVFSELEEPITVKELSEKMNWDEGNTFHLLKGLYSLGYLKRNGDTFCNMPETQKYLVKGKPAYMGSVLAFFCNNQGMNLGNVAQQVKEGPKPQEQTQQSMDFAAYGEAMRRAQSGIRQYELLEILRSLPEYKSIHKILDLGCGAGCLGIAVIQDVGNRKGVLFDRPDMQQLIEETVKLSNMQDSVSVKTGDFLEDDIGSGYDLILCSSIMLFAITGGANFFAKLKKALNPGGVVVCLNEGIEPDYSGPWDMILGYMAFNLQGMPIGVIKGQVADAAKAGGFHSVENRSVLLSTGMHDINILRNE